MLRLQGRSPKYPEWGTYNTASVVNEKTIGELKATAARWHTNYDHEIEFRIVDEKVNIVK